jgi:hypothetical protein
VADELVKDATGHPKHLEQKILDKQLRRVTDIFKPKDRHA